MSELSPENIAGKLGDGAMVAYKYFIELSKIPRGSGNESAAGDYLAKFGAKMGLDVIRDDFLNVLIKKNGSKGRENEPPVVMQAHIDMVCEKNSGVTHDFTKDPIVPTVNGDWVTAQQETTLGADNGGGLSMIMAVLAANDISHPPIEAIFTADEEAGMGGATKFDVSRLLGRRFINLDTEDDGVLTIGCAASADVDIVIPIERHVVPKTFIAYNLMIGGLAGGHSGMDIHKGLANANVLAARLIKEIISCVGYDNIGVSAINGGFKRNAIARECSVAIILNGNSFDAVRSVAVKMEAEFKSAARDDDKNFFIKFVEEHGAHHNVFKNKTLIKILDGILQTPIGVLSMSSEIDGLVQTSNNMGVVITDDETVRLLNFPRSSLAIEQLDTIRKLKDSANTINARFEIKNEKPAWSYKRCSPLRDKAAEVFKIVYGREADIKAVHAGLECGIFAEKLPDADFVSIGPNIRGAHSPSERMSISSFNRVYDCLVKLLCEL